MSSVPVQLMSRPAALIISSYGYAYGSIDERRQTYVSLASFCRWKMVLLLQETEAVFEDVLCPLRSS